MKIILSKNEINTIMGCVDSINREVNEVFGMVEKVAIKTSDGYVITKEKIDSFNAHYKGIAKITYCETEVNTIYTFEIFEEVTCSYIKLLGDAVKESFDVIKYGIKTFIAFKATKVKSFINKMKEIAAKAK